MTLVLGALSASMLTACSLKQVDLTGTWSSTKIANPSPLFASTLPDLTPGRVVMVLDASGRFAWSDEREEPFAGTYAFENGTLVLTTDQGDPAHFRYELQGGELVLETSDGFTFVFERGADTNP